MAAPEVQLGPLQGLLGFLMAQAQVRATQVFETHIGEPLGLRKVEFSLLLLLQANGPLPPSRVARTLSLTAPALTAVADRLEARGELKRERNPADGRSQHLVLTTSGRRLATRAAAAAATMEAPMLAGLSPAERAMLLELLGKLVARR